jgi:hypothetical protein
MRRIQGTLLVLAALLRLLIHAPAEAAEFGVKSLERLQSVRIEIDSSPDIDAVEVELAVLERLATVGIESDPESAAVLSVDAATSEGLVTAGAMLVQRICLERDPLLTLQLATWSLAETERQDAGDAPKTAAHRVLDRVIASFVADWRTANP